MASVKTFRRRCAVIAAFALLTTLAVGAGGASAAASCQGSVSQPFLPWLDVASYVLAPQGNFETATSWKLAGGARIVSGNETFNVGGASDSKALAIPAGGSATTPWQCVGLGHPTIRFFATGGDLLSPLKVEVIYKTVLGTVTQPVSLVPASSSWKPTLPLPFLANVTGLLSLDGVTSSVQFRFTALGNTGWKIDDVYVDPWKVT